MPDSPKRPKPPQHGRSRWLPDYPEPPAGEWIAYDYGKDIRGWYLDCGPMFHADIGSSGQGGYVLTLNMHPLGRGEDVEDLKRTAERHIVARVRRMIPAYKAIYGRVRMQHPPSARPGVAGPVD